MGYYCDVVLPVAEWQPSATVLDTLDNWWLRAARTCMHAKHCCVRKVCSSAFFKKVLRDDLVMFRPDQHGLGSVPRGA